MPFGDDQDIYDVAVLGGGNAGLCAALTAREAGARVIVVESAPRHFRGGNSRHTRNLRCMHATPSQLLAESYSEDEFVSDLLRASGPETDEALARLVIRGSAGCPEWMRRFGVRFQSPLRGTLHLARTNAFFLGGGKALMNSYYAAAERVGIRIVYDAEVIGLDLLDGQFRGATVQTGGRDRTIRARAAVMATGGFESNLDWLREIWGDAAANFIIRGTPYNKGRLLRLMLDAGAQPVGDARDCHAVAVDARAPKFDGGIVTRLDCLSLGIVVNKHAERFSDEGEDFWPKRYAVWGTLVARQPDQIAFSIVDAKAAGQFIPSVFPPKAANSIRELATQLNLSPEKLEATVDAFNRAVRPGSFNHASLDDCRTVGVSPEKTHWAQRIDTPPYWGYPLRPGITFTYLGLKVNERAQVLMTGGEPAFNICAAGEIMAGNILRKGYVAGVGMTIGTVFGRIAGGEAARGMPHADPVAHGAHVMTVCNACRYCEQFCPVFPAMESRLTFAEADLAYLANLCHNCGECLYACQYAPPHEFGINVPRAMAEIRAQSYEAYCWPSSLSSAFRHHNLMTGLVLAAALSAVMFAAALIVNGGVLPRPVGPGDFYAVLPHGFMVGLFGAVFLFVVAAIGIGVIRFWRDVLGAAARRVTAADAGRALGDVLTLRHLQGGGVDCTSDEEQRAPLRRWFHHCTFYGFLLCFASTSVAALYHTWFGWLAPYAYGSLPVLLGMAGGAGLLIGPAGLLILRGQRDPALADPGQRGMDESFMALLFLTSLTGFLLLALREQAVMSAVLVVHLGVVLALFLTLPYGKFVHGIYRAAALIHYAMESRRA